MTSARETHPAPRDAGGTVTPEARRLAVASGRSLGLVFTVAAMVNLVLPALDRLPSVLPVLAGLTLVAVGFAVPDGKRSRPLRIAGVYLAGLLALTAFLVPGAGVVDGSTLATATLLSSWAIPSLIVGLADRGVHPWFVVGAGVPVLALAVLATLPSGRSAFVALSVAGGWTGMSFAALWLGRSMARIESGVERLREAYVAERRSTEAEARLRYGARVLHDTVLATLSVVAHSGEGVSAAALRAQAAADGALLGRLREGDAPRAPGAAGAPGAPDARVARTGGGAAESASGAGGESLRELVGERFAQAGFSVVWHGSDQSGGSAEAREALAGAVAECLENVRRHSGRKTAEVTMSGDGDVVRVVVTDTGVGFERETVPRGKLGLAESVEARIASVGGSVRVFSALGRGTTVLLEVPA
ncbi:hypothetical protein N1031_18920 [Herbiconiux moechotypicola]|uniref:Histidine kinase/HSP90-like ATPase domain-containing protein n=1 Tax=Herbiconiux moechotypicola TaxID=637393 RepID=A0ABN3E4P0_9MICO|nr:ATP-binding protein [Herbiconiux moechotypicola]MCS5731833.1 hypothetical protein [Herbiconiux moechotypicola]